MKILFAAPEFAWGGMFGLIRAELPQHHLEATGGFAVGTLKGIDVLIPTMCPVTAGLLETADRLQLIQQCGAGLEGVDIPAAHRRNVRVANVPTDISGNADSVAELGIYLMIGLSRDVRGMARSLAERRVGQPMGRALSGKRVGLIGLGGIGRALIRRLRPFGVSLAGIKRRDPRAAQDELGLDWVGGPADLGTLLGQSDYVVLCLPLAADTRGLIDREALAAMKKEAFLVNLSRGGLIDRVALLDALAEKRIAGAGLDVYWEEPPDPADPLFSYNVLATPHVAGSTDVSRAGIAAAVVENIRRLERGQDPLYMAR